MLAGSDYTVDWVGVDNRVIRLRETDEGHPVVFANLVNNFPEAWNRWEGNEATLSYRFLVRGRIPASTDTGLDNAGETWDFTRFAAETTAPIAGRYTWLKSSPSSKSFMSVDGNVVLSTIRRAEEDVVIRLVNPDTRNPAEAVIQTNNQTIRLEPGEIRTIRLNAHHTNTTSK
jgi:hypothetical protein